MIVVDATSAVPVFEQIREQVGDLIRSGQLAADARLPSIRQLAGDLRIAPGTVARAYAELEAADLIVTSRATGTRVVGRRTVDEDLLRAAADLARLARQHSVDLNGALSAVRVAWGGWPRHL